MYDTSGSRYVNLEEIAALVREGKEVQVVDAKSGEDLTRVTLTQIITEDAKDKPTGLPLELLRQLIVASDQAGHEFISWYLKSAMDTYQKVQDAMQTRLSDMQSAVTSPLQTMRRFLGMEQPAGAPSENGELELLRQRIADLEARLEQAERTKRKNAGASTRGARAHKKRATKTRGTRSR